MDGDAGVNAGEGVITETMEYATIAAYLRQQRHHQAIVEAGVRACGGLYRQHGTGAGRVFRRGSERFSFELAGGCCTGGLTGGCAFSKKGRRDDFKRTDRSELDEGITGWMQLWFLGCIPSPPQELEPEGGAGAFYGPSEAGGTTVSPDAVEAKRETFAYKAKGVFDGDFAAALDGTACGRSGYYNFAYDKEGQPYSDYGRSGVLRPEDFETLLAYGRRKIGELAAGVKSGLIAAEPYRIGKTSPCGYCDYQSVCRFDWQINDYRVLTAVNKGEAIEKMREEL